MNLISVKGSVREGTTRQHWRRCTSFALLIYLFLHLCSFHSFLSFCLFLRLFLPSISFNPMPQMQRSGTLRTWNSGRSTSVCIISQPHNNFSVLSLLLFLSLPHSTRTHTNTRAFQCKRIPSRHSICSLIFKMCPTLPMNYDSGFSDTF